MRILSIAIAAIVVGALLGAVYKRRPREEAAPPVAAAPSTPNAAATLTPGTSQQQAVPAPVRVALTKSQQVDALVKAGDPVNAYRAYKLVRDCVFARKFEAKALAEPEWAKSRNWTRPTETCGDISPGQITSRLQSLNIAADAGVHGAVEDVSREGPTGDWSTPQDASTVAAWEARAKTQIETGVRTGDVVSLSTAFAWYNNGVGDVQRDLPTALAYAVAWNEAALAQTGKEDRLRGLAVEQLKAMVPKAQVAAAVEIGKQMVASAKSSPFWSNQ